MFHQQRNAFTSSNDLCVGWKRGGLWSCCLMVYDLNELMISLQHGS
jgi:hypothetical protein